MLRNLFINFSVHHCELRELTNESKRINAEVTKHVCVLITQRMLKHKGYISFYHLCLTMNKRSVKKVRQSILKSNAQTFHSKNWVFYKKFVNKIDLPIT